jgi:tRNA(adenine34) deaminase
MSLSPALADLLMCEALREAKQARDAGEVPIGAVVAVQGRIIGRGFNETERTRDSSAHAEMIAMRGAARILGNWRLEAAILCVTVEPCTMCTGALFLARVATVIFGVREPKTGALGSLYDLSLSRQGAPLRVIEGVREVESRTLLQDFFQSRR